MGCKHCNAMAIYRCSICGKLLCGEHTKLRTVCSTCIKKTASKYTIAKVMTTRERETIREFVQRFWGEEQLTFNEKFIVSKNEFNKKSPLQVKEEFITLFNELYKKNKEANNRFAQECVQL